ncbi:MAG: hypothetical protein KIT29_05080 [Anaerolineales bacterium]|jgi:hypothetical protein|nr:hypothetical protein [Anaerolineales bacterium]
MKSLSILVFLGTLSALIFGAMFAIKPVSAQAAAPSDPPAPQSETVLAPVTGAEAPQKGGPAAADPGAVLAQAFVINLQKDRSAPAVDTAPVAAAESAAAPAPAQATTLQSFASSVSNGNAGQVAGIYVEGVMAYGVASQGGNAAFVSEQPNVVTQFGLAAQYGSQGFLAHNYLAGGAFAQISNGQVITLVYGDGSSRDFQVTGTQRYQALSPDSTQSAFVDLNSGDQLSASSLFHKVYNQDNALVLQTCIERDGISTWGRLFITAVPLS